MDRCLAGKTGGDSVVRCRCASSSTGRRQRSSRPSYVVVCAEWARGGATNGASPSWLTLEAAAAGGALLVAWRYQDELRLGPLLALTAGYGVAIVLIHQAVGIPGDTDVRVYAAQGNQLLDGDYPRSEYPVGAVLLFGIDALLGGDEVRTTHGLLMIPFQVLTVGAVWALRTEWSGWLAALLAVWPASLLFVHLRYDAVVAALLVVGLVLARRERWVLAGAVLGVGAAVKWSPALACAVLVVWLVASRRPRIALRHGASFVVAFAALNLPFILWDAGDVVAAYTTQSTRGIIAESLPFVPLRLLGLAEVSASGHIWEEAVVPLLGGRRRSGDPARAARGRGRRRPCARAAISTLPSPARPLLRPCSCSRTGSSARSSHSWCSPPGRSPPRCSHGRRVTSWLLGIAAMIATYANAVVIPGFADPFLPWSALFFTVARCPHGMAALVDRPAEQRRGLEDDRHRAAVDATRRRRSRRRRARSRGTRSRRRSRRGSCEAAERPARGGLRERRLAVALLVGEPAFAEPRVGRGRARV